MSDHLPDVKEVPAKDWMTRWSALQVANESTQGIAASALFCEVVAEIERLQRENDTCGLQCSATMRSLLAEVEQLRTALTGISTCSTCEACRGAARLALGEQRPFNAEEAKAYQGFIEEHFEPASSQPPGDER